MIEIKKPEIVGTVPEEVLNALKKINSESPDEQDIEIIKKWIDGNKVRENFVQAWLEPDQDDSGSRHTRPISVTSNGTGLYRQGKMPRDL